MKLEASLVSGAGFSLLGGSFAQMADRFHTRALSISPPSIVGAALCGAARKESSGDLVVSGRRPRDAGQSLPPSVLYLQTRGWWHGYPSDMRRSVTVAACLNASCLLKNEK